MRAVHTVSVKCKDDLYISSTLKQHHPDKRRARSLSPVKNRKSLPPNFFEMKLPSLPYANSDDLRSLSSNSSSGNSGDSGTSSLSLEQLRKLSKSPISKRLHINTPSDTGHVIPIPFTITLPPKLSPKNRKVHKHTTPKSSPKPKPKLVFNGLDYEKIETLSSEDESELNMSRESIRLNDKRTPVLASVSSSILSPPSSPTPSSKKTGPPSVHQNKRKSVKSSMVHAKHMRADELSIIEEQSNSDGSSRSSSIRGRGSDDKSLPPPPESLADAHSLHSLEEQVTSEEIEPQPDQLEPIVFRNVQQQPSPVQTYAPLSPQRVQFETMPSSPKAQTQPQTPKRVPVRVATSPERVQTTEKELPPIRDTEASLPKYSTENNINGLTKANYLQIQKRSFSDESHVSSVSSFSSVGDVLSFTSRKSTMYSNQVFKRQVSNNSTITAESESSAHSGESTISNNSWDSLQKSIDLSRKSSGSSMEEEEVDEYETTISSEKPLPIPSPVQDSDMFNQSHEGSELADYYLNSTSEETEVEGFGEQSDLYEDTSEEVSDASEDTVGKASEGNRSVVTKLKLNTSDKTLADAAEDEDNKGAGINFNFPNNYDNATNEAKKRVASSDTFKSGKSRFSYYSTVDGQIEIPDLSEASFSELGSMRKSVVSVNGMTFDDLITDDDTEVEQLEPIGVPSQKGRRIVTEQFKHLYDTSDSDSDIGSTTYSLYSNALKAKSTPDLSSKKNADLPPLPVEQKQVQTPMRVTHSRNRSRHSRHKSMGNIEFNLDELTAEKAQPPVPTEQKAQGSPIEKDLEKLNIQVEDPPQRVDYNVDFRDSTRKENELTRTFTPSMNVLNRIRSGRASETESSYQSSRSARLTQSTGISDVESVVIDLTADEKYDVCMIQRQDSTLSYKSVTEMHKGKEVEVVLVDEDEYDLESIYSKYGKNWLGRSASMRSDYSSTSSTFSYNSMASESQLRLKQNLRREAQPGSIVNQRMLERSGTIGSNTSSRYNSSRIKIPPSKLAPQTKNIVKETPRLTPLRQEQTASRKETDQYFDYTKSSSYYDFNTFIHQKNQDIAH